MQVCTSFLLDWTFSPQLLLVAPTGQGQSLAPFFIDGSSPYSLLTHSFSSSLSELLQTLGVPAIEHFFDTIGVPSQFLRSSCPSMTSPQSRASSMGVTTRTAGRPQVTYDSGVPRLKTGGEIMAAAVSSMPTTNNPSVAAKPTLDGNMAATPNRQEAAETSSQGVARSDGGAAPSSRTGDVRAFSLRSPTFVATNVHR